MEKYIKSTERQAVQLGAFSVPISRQAAHIKRQQIKKIFAKKINNEKITNFALWKEKNYYLTRFYFPEP